MGGGVLNGDQVELERQILDAIAKRASLMNDGLVLEAQLK